MVFAAVLSFAQNEGITFTKQIQYVFKSKEDKKLPDFYFNTFGNAKGEFLSQSWASYIPMTFFTDYLGTTSVAIGLGSKLSYHSLAKLFERYPDERSAEKNFILKKLATKETVLGISCNHYLLSFSQDKDEDEYQIPRNRNLKICVDEKNTLNNYNVLLGAFNFYEKAKLKGDKPNGLILKLGSEEDYDNVYLVAKSIKDIHETVYFDHQAALEKQRKEKDSLIAERVKQEAEWEKMKAADSAVAVVDSATIAASDYADNFYDYIEKYRSEYKKDQHTDNSDYAINVIQDEKAWNILPKYCKNPSEHLPKLSNTEFVAHLKNYSSQVCDMYLTQSREHSVAVKQTMDEIRREVLYFNENKGKLSKEDQKKVEKYFNKLD